MLTSLQNPLIKQLRKLHQAKSRRAQGRFLIEGSHLLQEACALGHRLDSLCYTDAWQARYPLLAQQAQELAQQSVLVSAEVLAAIATTVNPDGVVATLPHQVWSMPEDIQLGLAIETLQDPGNLGSLIRTGAAAGCGGLWLSADSVDPENPKVLRSSAGQWFRLPVGSVSDLGAQVQQWQDRGIQVVATAATADRNYWQVDWRQPSVILLGNEGAGLSEDLLARASVQVGIPMAAGVESLNVAIAAALLLYEARRQRQLD